MVPKKIKSKRLTIKHQKKIHKRASEKHRKDRREAKKNPQKGKLKKDPGIPNLLPFKDKVLQQIEDHREQAKQDKLRQKDARSKLHDKNRNLDVVPKTMAELAKNALKRDAAFESSQMNDDPEALETVEGAVSGRRDNSKRAYYREFQKVVQHADVILAVLDARDPLGTRAPQIERMILDSGSNKRIILILNKIDLVPRDVIEKWLKYLRHEFPTLAFKASTQDQRKNLGHAPAGSKKATNLNTDTCVGAESLIQLLKNYSRNQKIKTSITVGVIGFPNVGKSSLINSLKRSRVCGVGSTPGFTKFVQEIHLDSKLKLLDCPGIVFNSPVKGSQKLDKVAAAEMMLRNCIKVELLEDPIAPVDIIVQRCNPAALQILYNVPAFLDTREFLVHLARQRGLLKRQGIADLIGAARIVLGDWNRGKIPYYTLPPGMAQDSATGKTAAGDAAAAHGAGRAVMVSEWAKEFDIDALLGDIDTKVLEDADTHNRANRRAIVMEGRTIAQDADMAMDASDDSESDDYSEGESDDSEAMEDSDNEPASTRTVHIVNLPMTRRTKKGAQVPEKAPSVDQMAEDSDNDDYNFGTYFKKPEDVAEDSESGSDEEL
ncbi:nuclear GTP-binding protein nug1 [Coemansia sp. RSA 1807]|nr:nuclear GTP-binding protein nug1 [Coemansia sp. RSA 520]KAJ2228616.1 nuclear GTP-binding protein nug1 [Coemansia sp. RSA 518]KAJ2446965.1 nuclear GTP-binding protein nug1 [Coemansia sp. RSA 2440]KAJ2571981.1 nuclear GTP-binding protein nug1 [Coemansia sp. RSA 1807]KAJ2591679.1 nuclear GTP-binding protein nug1 [Coemansia sp. RSA 1797]